MGKRDINPSIAFSLPIKPFMKSCGTFGICPDSFGQTLEALGLEVTPVPFPDGLLSRPSQFMASSKEFSVPQLFDLLIYFQIPADRKGIERLGAFSRKLLTENGSVAIMHTTDVVEDSKNTLYRRPLQIVRNICTLNLSLLLTEHIGIARLHVLSVFPDFQWPVLVFDSSNRTCIDFIFMSNGYWDKLFSRSPWRKVIIRLLSISNCLRYFVGKPLIIGGR